MILSHDIYNIFWLYLVIGSYFPYRDENGIIECFLCFSMSCEKCVFYSILIGWLARVYAWLWSNKVFINNWMTFIFVVNVPGCAVEQREILCLCPISVLKHVQWFNYKMLNMKDPTPTQWDSTCNQGCMLTSIKRYFERNSLRFMFFLLTLIKCCFFLSISAFKIIIYSIERYYELKESVVDNLLIFS